MRPTRPNAPAEALYNSDTISMIRSKELDAIKKRMRERLGKLSRLGKCRIV